MATTRVKRWQQKEFAKLNPYLQREAVSHERDFTFRGAGLEIQTNVDPEVLLSGPAGTGKSLAILNRIHQDALRYPGSRQLILRQTKASLAETILVTYEEHVLPPNSPIAEGPQRRNRQLYRYPNRSLIVVGGLDNPTKIFSGEYDRIYIAEAIEAKEDSLEKATTRLRWGKMPFAQLVCDTNPDHPRHWLKLRSDAGRINMLESRHEDNPALFDLVSQDWTQKGREYIEKLDRLTGSRYLRLRLGKWAASEGVIYDEFDAAIHIIDPFEVPDTWTRYWVIDFGYVNPFCWGHVAESPDGDLHLIQQIYMSKRLVEDHAADILRATSKHPRPVEVIADHDAEDRATFERKTGLMTTPAKKSVSDGIQAVKERLRPQGNGKPRIFVHRGCLLERDPELVDKALPTCVEEEFDAYVWDERAGQKKGDTPLKENDHGMDMLRYIVATKDLVGRLTSDEEMFAKFWGGGDE